MAAPGTKSRLFRCLKSILYALLFITISILTIATLRTFSLNVNVGFQLADWEKTNQIRFDISQRQREEVFKNFKEAIRIPTVSYSPTDINATALHEFSRLLRKAFPTVFSSSLVQHEVVADYSHLFTVQGSQPDLVPYMLLAHIDVVPASESDGWDAPPFSAKEIDNFIYGRGTLDDKECVMGILQALEYLLLKGYRPQRGFYIGLGHDEEVSGLNGALNIVRLLKQRNVQLSFLLDEGLLVVDGVMKGLDGPAALIGVSEKGSATVKLSVTSVPGHSSMPPRESSIGILAAAVKRLEDNPMPMLFGQGPERGTFEHLAHKFIFPIRFLASNLWLFAPIVGRTTTAVTMFNAGVKVDEENDDMTHGDDLFENSYDGEYNFYSTCQVNVLPSVAEAYVNFRIHSAQSLQEVLDLVDSTVGDQRVKVEVVDGFDPLPVSSYSETSYGFQIIKKSILDVFPQLTVAPGICVANTDSRHFKDLVADIYRFIPIWAKAGDAQRIHGINERISKKNYEDIVGFYFTLIQNCDVKELPETHSGVHEF